MKFKLRGRLLQLFAACSLALSSATYAAWGDSTISAMAGPWPIVIKTCWYDAGAICSLNWRNKEFINDYDHGRQLQSAATFDGAEEYFNPTEAGAEATYDGINISPSSSVLQGLWYSGNVVATQTQMAFWKPVNGSLLSNHILNKQVTIGAHGLAHVIEYLTQFTVPANETHSSGKFEVVTGYMPPEFSTFYTYDPATSTALPLSDGPGEQNKPIIFSTSDGGWAMGIYSPDSPQAAPYDALGYGRWAPQDCASGTCVKWNNVFRIDNPQGSYSFRSYVIVGSFQNVKDSMTQLYNIFFP